MIKTERKAGNEKTGSEQKEVARRSPENSAPNVSDTENSTGYSGGIVSPPQKYAQEEANGTNKGTNQDGSSSSPPPYTLIGWLRKTKEGKGIKINISVDDIEKLPTYTSKDGKRYVRAVVSTGAIYSILEGRKDVVRVSAISGDNMPLAGEGPDSTEEELPQIPRSKY